MYYELSTSNHKLMKRIKCIRFRMKGQTEELRFEKYTQFLFSEKYGVVIVINHNKGDYTHVNLFGLLDKIAVLQENSLSIELTEI